MSEYDDQLKNDINDIKSKLDNLKANNEKLDSKLVSMESKISTINKWTIVLCIIAILAVSGIALTVLVRK